MLCSFSKCTKQYLRFCCVTITKWLGSATSSPGFSPRRFWKKRLDGITPILPPAILTSGEDHGEQVKRSVVIRCGPLHPNPSSFLWVFLKSHLNQFKLRITKTSEKKKPRAVKSNYMKDKSRDGTSSQVKSSHSKLREVKLSRISCLISSSKIKPTKQSRYS